MENGSQQPLQYFEKLLLTNKLDFYRDCFINDFIEELGSFIKSVDFEKGSIEYWGIFDDGTGNPIEIDLQTSFQLEFIRMINDQANRASEILDNAINEITKSGNNPHEYIKFQKGICQNLVAKAQKIYPDFTELKDAVVSILDHIDNKYGFIKPLTLHIEHPNDYSAKSFLWDAIDDELRKETLSKLYDLLSAHPKIIDCSKEEFINAFSQKVVPNGIKWCVKGRSKLISKSSLFYFLEQLQSSFIEEVPDIELNERVKYVFRDENGNPLKNIRQSKNKGAKNPTSKQRIDQILEKIFK